ncbi:MAG: iron ABC transporter permease [Gammaproteobacteria bacterium]|nr:iron ABC transporter permease [Gammaproteobacteria bacterium]MBT3859985.1 iron ABC transporter permease [Gammaproteobacteria bacterium]MBT3986447.1 iron ABC transporter permease [Gammaproteobacteria bacterium]MBT4255266.1 iron ABC transporter permease [Gammaproteobacteria bacterium]MBT4580836.1 iron ABC transporter permease [Gammaproteobacteria bacterium]
MLLIPSLLLFSLASLLISLTSGSVDISAMQMIGELFTANESLSNQILWDIRIPRSASAFITGALLAMSGVIMQVLLRNPLADPYILGISGGAAVGALSAILLGLGGLWLTNAAFAGALFSILLVFGIANKFGKWSVTRLLLTGVVVSAGWGAVINILLTTTSTNNVQSMLFWLMGDLSQSQVGNAHFLLLTAALLGGLFVSRSLNVLVRGELVASALGINVPSLRLLLYFSASILTATAVTVAGSVGFVGLVIPHALRLLGARDHRLLIPGSLLLGGSFLLLADTIARTVIAPQQLPVGVVTAVIGVPAFILILRRSMKD